MKRLSFPLLFLCFLTLSACHAPKDLVFKSVKDVSVETLRFSDATLKLNLVFYNPNNMGLELNKTDFDIYINQKYFGKSLQNLQIKIPKRDHFTVPIEVKVDMKNVLVNGLTALTKDSVDVWVVGKARLGKAGVYKTYKVDYSTKQTFNLDNIF